MAKCSVRPVRFCVPPCPFGCEGILRRLPIKSTKRTTSHRSAVCTARSTRSAENSHIHAPAECSGRARKTVGSTRKCCKTLDSRAADASHNGIFCLYLMRSFMTCRAACGHVRVGGEGRGGGGMHFSARRMLLFVIPDNRGMFTQSRAHTHKQTKQKCKYTQQIEKYLWNCTRATSTTTKATKAAATLTTATAATINRSEAVKNSRPDY